MTARPDGQAVDDLQVLALLACAVLCDPTNATTACKRFQPHSACLRTFPTAVLPSPPHPFEPQHSRLPDWRVHVGNNMVLDGDSVFLAGQEALLRGQHNNQWAKAYYLPAQCDSAVVAARR